MLLSWYRKNLKIGQTNTIENLTNLSLMNKGFLNNLLNPKALLFFSLFLPQFTTGKGLLSVQILILGFMLSCFSLLVNSIFSITFSKFGKLVGDKLNLGRHIDGLLGKIHCVNTSTKTFDPNFTTELTCEAEVDHIWVTSL